MDIRVRTFFDTLIVTYISITAWGLYVTATHDFPKGPLRPFVIYSYGMMAPYQGASGTNAVVTVVGVTPMGTTELRSLDQYFPGLRGEKNSRQLMEQMLDQSPEKLRPYYEHFAKRFLVLERENGKDYVSIILWKEQWPRDDRGYLAGRDKGVKRTFLLRYP